MELDSRKNEAKDELKRMDIEIEVCQIPMRLSSTRALTLYSVHDRR